MAIVRAYQNKKPNLPETVRAAETAVIVGDVTAGAHVGLWYGAVVRGDHSSIRIGDNSNVQENAIVHNEEAFPAVIGRGVTVGHGAIIHGCTIEDNCLIGMGAILLNGCVIGSGSLVAAGALVTQRKQIPPNSLVVGSPAKVVRSLTEEETRSIFRSAEEYVQLALQELPPVLERNA